MATLKNLDVTEEEFTAKGNIQCHLYTLRSADDSILLKVSDYSAMVVSCSVKDDKGSWREVFCNEHYEGVSFLYGQNVYGKDKLWEAAKKDDIKNSSGSKQSFIFDLDRGIERLLVRLEYSVGEKACLFVRYNAQLFCKEEVSPCLAFTNFFCWNLAGGDAKLEPLCCSEIEGSKVFKTPEENSTCLAANEHKAMEVQKLAIVSSPNMEMEVRSSEPYLVYKNEGSLVHTLVSHGTKMMSKNEEKSQIHPIVYNITPNGEQYAQMTIFTFKLQ